jgi:hypothetical protein
MQLFLPHKINYSADSIPLSDVIESLQAQQRLLHEGVAVLARAAPDSDLRLVNIKVNSVTAGSLRIDLLLEMYHAYQESVDDKIIKGIEALTGTDVPPEAEALVTIATLGVAYFVARYAYDAVFKKKKKEDPTLPAAPPIHIEGHYNNVVTVIAGQLNVPYEAVDKAFHDEITPAKRRQLVGRVTDFLRPAKSSPGSVIDVEGLGQIDAETIAEYPAEYDLADLGDTSILNLPNAHIEIRALDRDSLKSGWKAKILGNDNFPQKLPMDLYPTIDAEKLADHRIITGDLAIEFIRDKDGTVRPKKMHLLTFEAADDNT